MGERELMLRAREGDAQAFDALLAQYMPMIEHRLQVARSQHAALTAEDEQDLRQVAHLAFYRALLSYDMAQGEVSLGLYAKVCVEHALTSVIRKMSASSPSLVAIDPEELAALPAEDGTGDPTRRLREQEDYEALCRIIARTLSPYENNIWQHYIAGATVSEIASALGKDTRSIHNAIYRIRRKLRDVAGAR
jgi:RNA polymerase sporulation-specific sigma factor